MYFPEKITLIGDTDRVLEIGPGASPHPRSNVLLEKVFGSPEEHARQCGGTPAALTDKRTVYYDGTIFPFEDGEFDYVICSHVIEHVPFVESFCEEMFRVAKAGYIEFPLVYYDYVFDIAEHVNLCYFREGVLFYEKKESILPNSMKPIQTLWYSALVSGYTDTVTELAPYLMQGLEWRTSFSVRRAERLEDLLHESLNILPRPRRPTFLSRVQRKLNNLWIKNGRL